MKKFLHLIIKCAILIIVKEQLGEGIIPVSLIHHRRTRLALSIRKGQKHAT